MRQCKVLVTIVLCLCTFLASSIINKASAQSSPVPTPTHFTKQDGQGLTISFSIPVQTGNLQLTGWTAPNATVTFLNDGAVIGTQLACPAGPPANCPNASYDGFFDKTFTGIPPGTYNYGIYAQDTSNPQLSTPTITRLLPILNGQAAMADVLTLPPTLEVEKLTMKRPETQTVRGMGKPNSSVRVFFDNANPFPSDNTISNNGTWQVSSNYVFHLGTRTVKAVVQGGSGALSNDSKIINFTVEQSADLNIDTQINLADFSILMFNFGLNPPPNWASDINDDANVDLADFSIMMFNWTGN